MNDNTPMPWGDHKGELMKDVPPRYLSWLLEQPWIAEWKDLHAYLKSRKDELRSVDAARRDEDVEGYQSFEDYREDNPKW